MAEESALRSKVINKAVETFGQINKTEENPLGSPVLFLFFNIFGELFVLPYHGDTKTNEYNNSRKKIRIV